MNDLDALQDMRALQDIRALRDLRASVPEPSSATLATGRARLTAALQAPPRPASSHGRAPARRPAIIAAGVLTALAVTTTVVALTISSAGEPAVYPHRSAPPGNSLRADLAVKILRRAAAAATHIKKAEPSSQQWFYSKTVDYEFGNLPANTVNEEWSTFGGQYTAYHQGGQLIVRRDPATTTGHGATALDRFDSTATPRTAYQALASLPSDPAALVSVISAHVAKLNPDQVLSPIEQYAPRTSSQIVFSYLVELMWNATDGEPPAAQAAVYLAMARLPGVTVEQAVTDAAGQTTIAVSDDDGIDQLLLDPRTYAVVGIREVSTGVSPAHLASNAKRPNARPWPPRGTVLESLAIAERKPVTGPGHR